MSSTVETKLTAEDRVRIKEGLRQKYGKVAVNPEGLFSYPTVRSGLNALNYDPDILAILPEAAVVSYCGVGNPFTLGPIHRHEAVLDIGCGGGVDSMAAATMAGPTGKVVGIDMIPEMLARARKNLRETSFTNPILLEASGENLPFRNASFDVVISNGVYNLISR